MRSQLGRISPKGETPAEPRSCRSCFKLPAGAIEAVSNYLLATTSTGVGTGVKEAADFTA